MLQKGGVAVFTIPGNFDETQHYSILDKVIVKYITPEQKDKFESNRNPFYLYKDKGVQFKKDLETAGF